jgi:choline dehydrogenase-like flavoprotein
MINAIETAALRTQQAAGRAWADLMNADVANRAELQANYDAAKTMQDAAYDAWKAAQ